MISWQCIVPSSVIAGILNSGARWGLIHSKRDEAERLLLIDGYSKNQGPRIPQSTPWMKSHYSRYLVHDGWSGIWLRTRGGLHAAGFDAWIRGAVVPTEVFQKYIHSWRLPPQEGWMCLTIEPDASPPQPVVFAWFLHRDVASPFAVELVNEGESLLKPLESVWPMHRIREDLVTVIGLGSIGSVVAEALAYFGIRKLALVDPDRLSQHNFSRHRANPTELGRAKVNVVAEMLLARDPDISIDRFPMSVVDDADVMRSLFDRSSIVITCSDGFVSRRLANHLAARARIPNVLACVLEDGAIGEILRCLPYRTQCLLCHREALIAKGLMDPEMTLGEGYGDETRPMAAVGGDLALVGQIAAKAAVATLLERRGDWGQRLAGDHAVIALRPIPNLLEPYDVSHCGEVVWRSLDAPSPSCFSCATGA